jgi:hypothetical protein
VRCGEKRLPILKGNIISLKRADAISVRARTEERGTQRLRFRLIRHARGINYSALIACSRVRSPASLSLSRVFTPTRHATAGPMDGEHEGAVSR